MKMTRVVDIASFGVAKRARTWVKLNFSSLRFRAAAASVCAPSPVGSQAWRSARVTIGVSQSANTVGCRCLRLETFPFLLATSWTMRTASASLPLPMWYFGDSKTVKKPNRTKNSTIDIAPITMTKYLQPILSDLWHTVFSSHVWFPRSGQATKVATT